MVEFAVIFIAIGFFYFIVFNLGDVLKRFSDNRVKIATANRDKAFAERDKSCAEKDTNLTS